MMRAERHYEAEIFNVASGVGIALFGLYGAARALG